MKTVLTTHLFLIIMFLPMFGKTQLVTISGNVTNSLSGKALNNVSIFESSSNIGTISNENGFFKLVLSQGTLEIKITNNGFNEFAQQIILKNDTVLNVQLEPEVQNRARQRKQDILHADAKTAKKFSGQRLDK